MARRTHGIVFKFGLDIARSFQLLGVRNRTQLALATIKAGFKLQS